MIDWNEDQKVALAKLKDYLSDNAENDEKDYFCISAAAGCVTGDTKIHIEGGAGVDSITVDTPQDNNVYNLQGVMVIENASADDINNLAKGVYIINHKKVIK